MSEIKIYEVDEVAEILKVSKATIYKLLRDNKLKYIRIARKYLITENSIYEFVYGVPPAK